MEEFTEDHSERLRSKEWLVKVDDETSVAYLMKVHPSFADQTCVFLITDTKAVWVEVLSSRKLSRRWSALNTDGDRSCLSHFEEDRWLNRALQYLVDTHSPNVLEALSFAVSGSRYSDLAIDLGGESFKWRWETFSIGPKQSADVLSKQLMMPLFSIAYLALTKTRFSEISHSDLEEVVDRIGQDARRSVSTVFSSPRTCTIFRRLSALFASSDNPPAILDHFEEPELTLPSVDSAAGSERIPTLHTPSVDLQLSQSFNPRGQVKLGSKERPSTKAIAGRQGPGAGVLDQVMTGNPLTRAVGKDDDDDDDDDMLVPSRRQQGPARGTTSSNTAAKSKSTSRASSPAPSVPGTYGPASAARRGGGLTRKTPSSDPDSPPHPSKRAREKGRDRDSDSDDGAKRGELRWRGTKQPIKRVGRRF
ncbi:hypothetical protein F5148DRAFT_203203 [Russula earlei]|uniref:Uncharacterized protein n=1 Tax=Russula earlei TaxID=71964 RepID=A0ACC0UL97_9AGAM|nr:hypothetical protein F5148DRAFT_203203 [Russula earlei]